MGPKPCEEIHHEYYTTSDTAGHITRSVMSTIMATEVVTGIKEIDRQLSRLSDRAGKRINAAAIRKGQAVILRAIRNEAPRGPTGNLKRAIGHRFRKKRKSGIYEAIIGANVGKRTKSKTTKSGKQQKANSAQHAHLVILGTAQRLTKAGASRGVMPSNNFVDRGFASSKAQAASVIKSRLKSGIDKEIK